MEELPETLKAEIEALDSLDARALKRRYADIVADMPKCALSSVLRATITPRVGVCHLAGNCASLLQKPDRSQHNGFWRVARGASLHLLDEGAETFL